MPLQPLVVGQDFRWRIEKRRAAKRTVARVLVQQQRDLPDATGTKLPAKLPVNLKRRRRAEIARLNENMPSIRHQALDLGVHLLRYFRIARGEGNDNGLWIFTEQSKEEFLERPTHLMEFDRDHFAGSMQLCIG